MGRAPCNHDATQEGEMEMEMERAGSSVKRCIRISKVKRKRERKRTRHAFTKKTNDLGWPLTTIDQKMEGSNPARYTALFIGKQIAFRSFFFLLHLALVSLRSITKTFGTDGKQSSRTSHERLSRTT